jgi:hypothetical protein
MSQPSGSQASGWEDQSAAAGPRYANGIPAPVAPERPEGLCRDEGIAVSAWITRGRRLVAWQRDGWS